MGSFEAFLREEFQKKFGLGPASLGPASLGPASLRPELMELGRVAAAQGVSIESTEESTMIEESDHDESSIEGWGVSDISSPGVELFANESSQR